MASPLARSHRTGKAVDRRSIDAAGRANPAGEGEDCYLTLVYPFVVSASARCAVWVYDDHRPDRCRLA